MYELEVLMKLNAYIIKDYVSFSIITSFLNSSPLDCNLAVYTTYLLYLRRLETTSGKIENYLHCYRNMLSRLL